MYQVNIPRKFDKDIALAAQIGRGAEQLSVKNPCRV